MFGPGPGCFFGASLPRLPHAVAVSVEREFVLVNPDVAVSAEAGKVVDIGFSSSGCVPGEHVVNVKTGWASGAEYTAVITSYHRRSLGGGGVVMVAAVPQNLTFTVEYHPDD